MREIALLFLLLPIVVLSYACDEPMPVEPKPAPAEPETDVTATFDFASVGAAKELYVVSGFSYLHAYSQALEPLRASPGPIVHYGRGLAIDTESGTLFVDALQGHGPGPELVVVDAITLGRIGQYQFTTGPYESQNGIVYDHKNQKVYYLKRPDRDLYVFSWDATTRTLSLDEGSPHNLGNYVISIDVDEEDGLLYVTTGGYTLTYNTNDWTFAGLVPLYGHSSCGGGPVAVDVQGEHVYLGVRNGFCQIDLKEEETTEVTTPGNSDNDPDGSCSRPNDIAVDQETGLVYVTNYGGGGWCGTPTKEILVYDAELNLLESLDLPYVPYGIAVPRTTNHPPTADPTGPYTGDEGSTIICDGTGSGDPDGDGLSYGWDFGDGNTSTAQSPSHTYDNQGSYIVCLTVTDPDGLSDEQCTEATISNVAPTGTFGHNGPVDEGQSIILAISDPTDPSSADVAAGFEYSFDCGDGSGYGGFSATASATCSTEDNGTRTVGGKIRDTDGAESEYTALVEVHNVAPTCSIKGLPTSPVQIGQLDANGSFVDPGTADTHTSEWNWGDSTTSPGTVGSDGSVTGSHPYLAAGVYAVDLTVTDDDGGVCSVTHEFVVMYDPDGGFVTGGGWIDSPAGAYRPNTSYTGKATFGFVSKYKNGASVPTGNTQFQFKAGDLNFHSNTYEWLVVNQGGTRAQYKGSGTINGAGDYRFILWATDDATDKFRIRIWDENELTAVETDIYDNNSDQAISGGSIVVHKR